MYRLFFLLILFASCNSNNGDKQLNKINPCDIKEDIIHRKVLTIDSSERDLSDLLEFIENKGELSRRDRLQRLDSSVEKYLQLSRLLCRSKGESSVLESWIYDSVYRLRVQLSSIKPIPELDHLDFTIYLTQYNFSDSSEMKIVLSKLKKFGFGDPRKKWNNHSVVIGKNRIYIVKSAFARSEEIQKKYARIIEKEWVKLEK